MMWWTSFNAIIGQTTLHRFYVVMHHNFLCLKISTRKGVITMRGTQSLDRKILFIQEAQVVTSKITLRNFLG